MKTIAFTLIGLFLLGCDNPGSPIDMKLSSPHKGKPFASIKAAQGTFLEILTTDVVDAYGNVLHGLRVSTTAPGFVHFEFVLANTSFTENFWSGAYPDPDRYTETVPIKLKHLFKAEVVSNGSVVSTVEPELADAGEDSPLDNVNQLHHESSTFDGFWISSRWANFTTENNAGSYTETGGQMTFPDQLPDGDYTLRVTLDPLGFYGQGATYEIPFTLAFGTQVTQASFKK